MLIPSLATSEPNLLVMPLSSSSTCNRPRAQVTGLLVGVWMDPFSIPVSMVFSSDCSEAGTTLAKSWNGERTAPPLASVPTYVPPLNVLLAALSTAVFTADWMPLVTLVTKYLQYCCALMHPSVSTQNMFTFWLPAALSASWTALAAPRPTLPATGKMMSAPSLMNVWVVVWPFVWLVKSPVKDPFWVASLQPSTCTFVLCWAL